MVERVAVPEHVVERREALSRGTGSSGIQTETVWKPSTL